MKCRECRHTNFKQRRAQALAEMQMDIFDAPLERMCTIDRREVGVREIHHHKGGNQEKGTAARQDTPKTRHDTRTNANDDSSKCAAPKGK
jgi:hypothetical protein